jgi:hypothetical protein
LIINPGFESFCCCEPGHEPAVNFDGWTVKNDVSLTKNPQHVHTLAVAAVLGDFGGLKQLLELSPEWGCLFLRFSFFAKAEGPTGSLYAALIYLDQNRQPIHPLPLEIHISHIPAAQYEFYSFLTAEPVVGNAFYIEVLLKNLQNGRRVFIDDVSLSSK